MPQVGRIVIVGGGSASQSLATELDVLLGKAGNTRDLRQQQNTRDHGLSYDPVVMCGLKRSVRPERLIEFRTPYFIQLSGQGSICNNILVLEFDSCTNDFCATQNA